MIQQPDQRAPRAAGARELVRIAAAAVGVAVGFALGAAVVVAIGRGALELLGLWWRRW